MSFNLYAAPGRTVIVNNASTSPHEDGSWANPYKTIQAAFNARPAITAPTAFLLWEVLVVPGFYDEDLIMPMTGIWALRSISGFALGVPGGVQRSVTWNTAAGTFGEPALGVIASAGGTSISITGGFTITGGVGARPTLMLQDVNVEDPLDGTGIIEGDDSSVSIVRGSYNNGINVNAWVDIADCNPDGLVCFNARRIRDAVISGNLTVTDISPTEALKLDRVEVTGNVTLAGVHHINDLQVSGTFLQVGAGEYIEQLRVSGLAQFGLFGRVSHSRFEVGLTVIGGAQLDHVVVMGIGSFTDSLVANNCFFSNTVTVATTATFLGSRVILTLTADIVWAVASTFTSVTVMTDSQFMASSVTIAFIGPPGSFRLDAATNALSVVTPPGVKTLLHNETI